MDVTQSTIDLEDFEGFNFRDQSALARRLTAEEVIGWDHEKDGEAEFWPAGDNVFMRGLLPGSACTAADVREVIRIFEELDGCPQELVKAVYLRERGSALSNITRQAVDDSCLYVFGPGHFIDLEKEAAYDLFEAFWPDAYKQWEQNNVPGLDFDPEGFLSHFATHELKLSEDGGYLIVSTV
jgi:hypothetical protein